MHSTTSSSSRRSSSGSFSPTDWEKTTSPSTTPLTSPNRSPPLRQDEYRPPVTALRAACNDCHRAKVKCVFDDSPTTSACIRCQKRNRDCGRSLSKPLGRARGSRKKQAAAAQSGSAACADMSNTASGRSISSSVSSSSPGLTAADQASSASPAVHDVSNHHHCHDQDPGSAGGGGGGRDQGLGYVADFDVDSLLEGVDVNNVAAAAATATDTTMDDLWFDSAAAHHSLASSNTPLLYEQSMAAAADTKTTTTRDHSWDQTTTTPRVPHHHHTDCCCSCTAALLATMRDHSRQHQYHRQTSSGSSTSPDQLLALNAAALDVARACLECPVPHDTPALLLLYLAQDILANCRVAALGVADHVDCVDADGRRVSVTLGSYAVADREDGAAVARRIIALQAQKIVPVLDGLLLLLPSQRDCYGGGEGRGRSGEEDEACRLIAGLLRAEVDGMIAALSS